MNEPARQVDIIDTDGLWKRVEYEADIGFGWMRFHYPSGQVAIAAPGRWRDANDNIPAKL